MLVITEILYFKQKINYIYDTMFFRYINIFVSAYTKIIYIKLDLGSYSSKQIN